MWMTKLISLENLGNFVNILGIDDAFAEVEEAEIINKEKLENSIEDILWNTLISPYYIPINHSA